MFKPFELTGTMPFIRSFRNIKWIPQKSELPDWIVYNLPDGLWLLAFYLLMEYIWTNDCNYAKITFNLIISIAIISWEVLQYLGTVQGTWDEGDILAYLTALIIYYFTTKKYGQ